MRLPLEAHFESDDKLNLFYRAWLPGDAPMTKAVILFHRGHEHSGRFQELVEEMDCPDIAFFAWDARGCGRSPGARGDARSLGQLENDMDAFVRHLCQRFDLQTEQMVVLAHSVAAVVAGLWVLDYAPRLRGLILATPALEVKLYVPFARPALAALSHWGRMTTVTSYVRGQALTHDRVQARLYDQDPLISKTIATRVLLDLDRGARRLLQNADLIQLPTQVLVARADWVVKNGPIRELHQRLGGPQKSLKVYPGFFHSVFHEKDRQRVFRDVRAFVQQCFEAQPADLSSLEQAHHHGPSADRHAWLQAGPPPISFANAFWTATRFSLKTFGRLSRGIRLGFSRGFSSGETLDYVYENKPRGWTPLGKLFDSAYLNSVGWVCIRRRRLHLETLLAEALDALGNGTSSIRLLDIAGGPARYLLQTLQRRKDWSIQATVQDLDEQSLERGRQLAAQLGEERIVYRAGDALRAAELVRHQPLDLAVVSGLYELCPSNEPVLESLRGLAEAVREGGYLVYTNQPSHPTLELIAETLTHADGSRWVMRCRSSAEMDQLVRRAGFVKVRTLIDDHGIFSVSLAQRQPVSKP